MRRQKKGKNMDNFEKVEKLRERANVSYEEAKAALEENNWDLLDAMVALEKNGKADGPKQQQYSTSYDQQQEYIPVKTTVEEQQKKEPKFGKSVGEALQTFFRICKENMFCVARHGEMMIRIPLFAAAIILLFTWRVAVPVMLVALLFGFRYSIEGKDDLREVNAFMESAGNAAENLKEGFMNAHSGENVYRDAAQQETAQQESAQDDTLNQ